MRFLIYFVITLALAGLEYSFFIVFPWFFGNPCLASGGCLTFLGVPSCIYAVLFFGLAFGFGLGMLSKDGKRREVSMRNLFWTTFFGMLSTLYFSIQELFVKGCQGEYCVLSLYYPSCLYCFVIFVMLFGLTRYITGHYSHNQNIYEK